MSAVNRKVAVIIGDSKVRKSQRKILLEGLQLQKVCKAEQNIEISITENESTRIKRLFILKKCTVILRSQISPDPQVFRNKLIPTFLHAY